MSWAWAPGTWGELIQGESEGRRLLVSLPSSSGSLTQVTIRPRPKGSPMVRGGGEKSRRAVQRLLVLLHEQRLQVHLSVKSTLRPGVGHAPSSADVLSALRATCRALSRSIPSPALCWLAAQVEPTNPTLLTGANLFDPDRGHLLGQGPLPAMKVLPLSCGAAIDTVKARQHRIRWNLPQQGEMIRIMEWMRTALGRGDLRLMAKAATRSALMHAERTERTDILRAWERARSDRALGIAVSHSGSSIVGIYPPNFRNDGHV